MARRADRGGADPGQEQGARPLGAPQRAADGPARLAGFHWMYRHAYISVEEELEAFNRVTLDDLRRLLLDWPLWPLTIVSVGPTTDVHQAN